MQANQAIQRTRECLPEWLTGEVKICPIEKGGSGRKFYRISCEGASSLILIQYDLDRPENTRYADLANFLDCSGVHVPKVYGHDPEHRLMWMEDFGREDLLTHHDGSWKKRRSLYQAALKEVHHIHVQATKNFALHPQSLESEFDENMYLWEQNYFFDHCLRNVFGMSQEELAQWQERGRLREIAQQLASLPKVLVHRDFQSQNIMLVKGRIGLIDFQGMRFGLAAYDVASLLYDPYMGLTELERNDLVGDYLSLGNILPQFATIYPLCALQRTMQALGAYGFLGLTRNKPEFLQHIPTALTNLQSILPQVGGLSDLAERLSMESTDILTRITKIENSGRSSHF